MVAYWYPDADTVKLSMTLFREGDDERLSCVVRAEGHLLSNKPICRALALSVPLSLSDNHTWSVAS